MVLRSAASSLSPDTYRDFSSPGDFLQWGHHSTLLSPRRGSRPNDAARRGWLATPAGHARQDATEENQCAARARSGAGTINAVIQTVLCNRQQHCKRSRSQTNTRADFCRTLVELDRRLQRLENDVRADPGMPRKASPNVAPSVGKCASRIKNPHRRGIPNTLLSRVKLRAGCICGRRQ